jgi:hypothetical protein
MSGALVAGPLTVQGFNVVKSGTGEDMQGWERGSSDGDDRRETDVVFLTNQGQILAEIARRPGVRIRELALNVGVTERAAHRIVQELVAAGYLTKHRLGSRNFYEVHAEKPLSHPAERDLHLGELLRCLLHSRTHNGYLEPASSPAD